MLHCRDEPLQYRLSTETLTEEQMRLTLHISKEVAREINFDEEVPIVKVLKERFKFKCFLGKLRKKRAFGFDEVLRVDDYDDCSNTLSISIPIPQVEHEEGECLTCRGKLEDEWGDRCHNCLGSGRERKYEHKPAFAISATLNVLFGFMNYRFPFDLSGAESPLQLLHVLTATDYGLHGTSLSGAYSKSLVAWLAEHPENTALTSLSGAMQQVHQQMFPLRHTLWSERDFLAWVQKEGWLNISCPGNACGLHPSHHSLREGRGYEFSCHNVDTPAQQITLLTALAALSDEAMRDRVCWW